MKSFLIPVTTGATGIVTEEKYLEIVPGNNSIDSLQKKKAVLGKLL
jgi:hypothetical protein